MKGGGGGGEKPVPLASVYKSPTWNGLGSIWKRMNNRLSHRRFQPPSLPFASASGLFLGRYCSRSLLFSVT